MPLGDGRQHHVYAILIAADIKVFSGWGGWADFNLIKCLLAALSRNQ